MKEIASNLNCSLLALSEQFYTDAHWILSAYFLGHHEMWPYLHRRFPLWTDASAGAIRSGVATGGSLPLTSYGPTEASVGSKFFEEEVMIKNFVLSDFGTKTAYFSLVAAAVVFVSMLLLTGLHP